ncbi:MAG: ATP-binding cassette domain-containing protein [Raoultibacter sp.]|jgi:putative ABC transport system permease protein
MLQLFDIRKSYTTADFTQTALDDVSIAFRDNEFVAILGPSGSGKTTMLNIIGGLDQYDSGELVVDGISTREYKDRDWDTYRNNRIGFVFQSYNLIPHQSVLANVELALTLSGVSRAERHDRAKRALEQVGLAEHVNKKPNQLSGGQMQRVAVARALINDPEILLADEPTGALDSTTSVQIMELLTEIANDRLVIMVTHNPELADEYANRIVNLRDGRVTDDSNPYEPTPEETKLSDKPIRRTKMSYLTALSLSFNNLMTKKGRTIMTAFAGSIGIIGIAAILALANGVNNYIKNVEEETLSVYPLTIEGTGFDMTSMMVGMMGVSVDSPESDSSDENAQEEESSDSSEDGGITETKSLAGMFSSIGSNDLASLKTYLEGDESNIYEYANMISYDYNITPQIFSPNTADGAYQVNPNKSLSELSSGSLTGSVGEYASMATSGSNANVFSQLLENRTLLDSQYDVVAGHWPENYDELVLVLNSRGGVSDLTLYAMGLRDRSELNQIVSEVANNEEANIPEEQLNFSYEELMDVTFKLVNSADMYQKDTEYNVWKDKAEDTEYMRSLIDQGEELKIVGIVAVNEDASANALMPGLCYTSDLQLHLIEEAEKRQIVQEQKANPELNVISGRTFQDEKDNPDNSSLDFSSMITVDSNAISNAFSFNASALQIDSSGLTNLNIDPSTVGAVPTIDFTSVLSGLDIDVDQAELNTLINSVVTDFSNNYYVPDPVSPTPEDVLNQFTTYLYTPQAQAIIAAQLPNVVDPTAVTNQVQTALTNSIQTAMQGYMTSMMTSITSQISSAMSTSMAQLSANMAGAMSIDEQAFANAFQFNMDEEDLRELMTSLMTRTETTYDSNLSKFGYADTNKPASINIYPIDFASKEKILEILDSYNSRMEDAGEEDKVIVYTDIVGTLMSSVTTIVDMISYVLVAFVAISLIVSSIMIGIITYISVLERRKEIGILRSIGASKKDISHVFNAETLIVGLVAGVIGIGITALLCIPANIIIEANFGVKNVALLPWEASIVLILISCFLSFVAGLLPSSSASRKDPVEALRSE